VSGLKLTIPNGRQADEKRNHLEFSVSSWGYTKSTGVALVFSEAELDVFSALLQLQFSTNIKSEQITKILLKLIFILFLKLALSFLCD